jgi:HlyD family secretion protein
MYKLVIVVLALVLVAGGTFLVFKRGGASASPAAATPELTKIVETGMPVVAKARVVPVRKVELKYPSKSSGDTELVREVLVQEGDRVEQGAPLIRLDTRDLQLRVEEAQANVAQAKANYDLLLAGASPQEIDQSHALLSQTQAKLREVKGNVTTQDITAAQRRLDEARANLSLLEAGPKNTKIQVAQSILDRAHANLQSQHDSLSAAKTNAQLRMEQAANALRDRQADYSRIHTENETLGSAQLDQQSIDRETAALHAMEDAEKALTQASVAYEQAKQAEITGVAAAEADRRSAQAALDELLAGADAGQLSAARAQVADAEANLAKLQGDQRAGSLDVASAEVMSAEANLNKITAPPRTIDLAKAQALLQQTEVARKRSELDLDLATLQAPIAGTVVNINLREGEALNPLEPAVVLADLSSWQLETEDLNEQSVVRIHEGDPVTISFDALPDFQLQGKVTRIKAIGGSTATNFNVTYTVIITPERPDQRLRWNMTASVNIMPGAAASTPAPNVDQPAPSAEPPLASTAAPPTTAPAAVSTPTASAADYIEYTVQKDDLLSIIAQQHGVSVKEILEINQIANPDSLQIGQIIRIPRK